MESEQTAGFIYTHFNIRSIQQERIKNIVKVRSNRGLIGKYGKSAVIREALDIGLREIEERELTKAN